MQKHYPVETQTIAEIFQTLARGKHPKRIFQACFIIAAVLNEKLFVKIH